MHCMTAAAKPKEGAERRTQMLKGVLDLCVLSVLRDGPLYGYGLVGALAERGLAPVAEGSVYPLLARLERQGLVHSYRAPSPDGPSRKYYQLTQRGRVAASEGITLWRSVADEVTALLERP